MVRKITRHKKVPSSRLMTLVLNGYKQVETNVHVVGVLAKEYISTRKLIGARGIAGG